MQIEFSAQGQIELARRAASDQVGDAPQPEAGEINIERQRIGETRGIGQIDAHRMAIQGQDDRLVIRLRCARKVRDEGIFD